MTATATQETATTLVVREQPADGVTLLRLNRPEALNALSPELMQQLSHVLHQLATDDSVKVVILTGSEKAFAAGADIRHMAEASMTDALSQDFLAVWDTVADFPKPVISAVSGYALGGGLELAMMGDIILAAENARFGQPEINLGIIPGAGATQRLTRVLGKFQAMALILSGQNFTASEALQWGLVSHVFPVEQLLPEAVKLATTIAGKGSVAVRLAKQAILAADRQTLTEGLRTERQLFYQLFATQDQKEGMNAFLEKRPAQFSGK